ncbi:MAG: hypothetical protein GXY61_02215 [Lentisphaerae bacterium]|nr:hypothetical protein [Lentisphaerota bacterium]
MEPQERSQEIIDSFKKRKVKQLIVSVPVILAIIPLVMLEDSAEEALFGLPVTILVPVCIAVFVAGLIFSMFNWRCPACGKYLGKALNPKFCVKCGAQLK